MALTRELLLQGPTSTLACTLPGEGRGGEGSRDSGRKGGSGKEREKERERHLAQRGDGTNLGKSGSRKKTPRPLGQQLQPRGSPTSQQRGSLRTGRRHSSDLHISQLCSYQSPTVPSAAPSRPQHPSSQLVPVIAPFLPLHVFSTWNAVPSPSL